MAVFPHSAFDSTQFVAGRIPLSEFETLSSDLRLLSCVYI